MKEFVKNKKIIFTVMLFALIMQIFILNSKVYALDSENYTEKQIIAKNYIDDTEEDVTIRLYGEIPYIKLSVLYNLISPADMTINSVTPGVYEARTYSGVATINTINDTLHSNDYSSFIELPGEEDDIPIMIKNYKIETTGSISSTDIDFTKYEIDLLGDSGDVWVPVSTGFDMFKQPSFYDGDNINIFDIGTATEFIETDEYVNKISGFFENNTRSNELSKFTYDELCFVVDTYYGFPRHSDLTDSIKAHGLDYTLSNYNNDTRQIKEWLLSTNMLEYHYGLSGLDEYLHDGGHTMFSLGIGAFLTGKLGFFGYFDVLDDVDTHLQILEKYNSVSDYDNRQEEIEDNIMENRSSVLDGNYIESGDTALYSFDSFKKFDFVGWNNYYQNGGEYPDDTIGNFLKALDRASLNQNIKNFVIDISANDGGIGVLAPIMMAYLGYTNSMITRNMITNQSEKITFDIDINRDGVITDADKVSKYNFNYAVLTSDLTFSTANLFASYAKDNGFMLLGEKSSGGACTILPAFSSEGLIYTLSSYDHLIDKNGNSVDGGVEVDKNLVTVNGDERDYSKYYDLAYLSTIINEFYSKKSDVIVEEIADNIGNATITNTSEELKEIMGLTPEEIAALAQGKKLYVIIEVKDASNSVTEEDKKLIESVLDKDSKIGIYLDINLFKEIEGENKVKVEETNGKIKISFEIPESLRNSNREFYIVRIHDGEATKINATVEGNILSFETDKFSTYALIYNDIVNPKTGDNIMFYVATFGLSVIGLVAVVIYLKKKGKIN